MYQTSRVGFYVVAVWSVLLGGPVSAIDFETALAYFEQARQISEADDGHLWGRKLYGPMLFVDRATRTVVANEPDKRGILKTRGSLYTGILPNDVTVANTATRWAGKHWTMLMWPLPEDTFERANLLAHEMWHRIQGDLGLPGNNPGNVHLDAPEGRLWLRLEWRALGSSLRAKGDDRKTAVLDALIFREFRRSLFGDAAHEERALENNEGLAEYTGVMLAGFTATERTRHVLDKLHEAELANSFVRSFAYKSGPPWGILLDDAGVDWRAGYSANSDLGARLSRALDLKLPANLKAVAAGRMTTYNGHELDEEERQRDQRRQQRLTEARARFIIGPTLRLPLRQMKIEFNPNNLQPLDDVGTVYPTLRIADVWGILEVTNGALVSADWTWVAVPVENDWNGGLESGQTGWTLEPKEPWRAQRSERKGQWELARKH